MRNEIHYENYEPSKEDRETASFLFGQVVTNPQRGLWLQSELNRAISLELQRQAQNQSMERAHIETALFAAMQAYKPGKRNLSWTNDLVIRGLFWMRSLNKNPFTTFAEKWGFSQDWKPEDYEPQQFVPISFGSGIIVRHEAPKGYEKAIEEGEH